MKLVVISHKPCWNYTKDSSIFVTDGGFPLQIKTISDLFESTKIVVPIAKIDNISNKLELKGNNITIVPLSHLSLKNTKYRRLVLPFWLLRNSFTITKEIIKADVVHTPIPGDIGTIGMLIAFLFRKKLFVRYCGNWENKRTKAEKFWKWFLIKYAGGRNIFLATGGQKHAPSDKNKNIKWVFSTSLTKEEILQNSKYKKTLKHPVTLAILGRQEKGKGTEELIRAMVIILKEFPDTKLNIIGDGSLHKNNIILAKKLRVYNNINFVGYVKHKEAIKILLVSDLFCFPTASEGFPKVVLEALSCNLPVITTNVSVLPILIGNDCGRILKNVTPENIAENVISVISDKTEYQRLSKNAGEKALQYSIENWKETLKNHFSKNWSKYD